MECLILRGWGIGWGNVRCISGSQVGMILGVLMYAVLWWLYFTEIHLILDQAKLVPHITIAFWPSPDVLPNCSDITLMHGSRIWMIVPDCEAEFGSALVSMHLGESSGYAMALQACETRFIHPQTHSIYGPDIVYLGMVTGKISKTTDFYLNWCIKKQSTHIRNAGADERSSRPKVMGLRRSVGVCGRWWNHEIKEESFYVNFFSIT